MPVPVWPGKTALSTGGGACTVITIMVATVPNVAVACLWTVAPKVSAAASTTMLVSGATGQVLETGVWAVITVKPVDAGNILDQVMRTVETAELGCDEITEAGLSILVDAGSKAMQAEVQGEVVVVNRLLV
jgi:hypothetical protein